MALPLTETDKFLLLSAVGAPETRDRIAALLDLAGTGNMTGPASATDNAVTRFDGTTGALVQNSGVVIDDSNNITGVAQFSSTNFRSGDGLLATPAFSFTSDADTGIYRSGSGDMRFVSNGSERLSTQATVVQIIGVPLFNTDGAAATPSYTFTSDSNTGMYSVAGDSLGISTGGTLRLTTSTTAITSTLPLVSPTGAAATPSYTFTGDTDTGFYSVGANNLGFSTGGTLRFDVSTAAITSTLPALFANGAVGTPAYSFSADSDTGMYLEGVAELAFATAGVRQFKINTGGDLEITGRLLSEDGVVGAPTYSFGTDSDCGMFLSAANQVTLATAGVAGITVSSAQAVTLGTGAGATHRLNTATATADAEVLTLTNGPVGTAGNPDVYLQLNINGTNYAIPAWAV